MSVMDEPCELLGAAEELVESRNVQPRRRLGRADGRAVAAERPVRRTLADAGRDRITKGIQNRCDQVRIALDMLRKGPVFEEMRFPTMTAVRATGVVAVQQLKAWRKARSGRPEHEVVMVGHHAPRKDFP